MSKYSMGSSVAESKQTSVPPSLTNWRRAPRERAPIEKGKTAPCNRSPANPKANSEPKLSSKKRAALTDFRPRHLFDTPTRDGRSGSLHTPPGQRHSSTAWPCLLEFRYPHQDSIGLHSPSLVGGVR